MNYKNTQQAEDTIDLLASSFDLVRGKLDYESWLKKFAVVVNADSAACVRWSCGIPDKPNTSVYGNSDYLTAGWTNWADPICQLSNISKCEHLDEIAHSLNRPALFEANPLQSEQVMAVVADWSPAYICMIAHRDKNHGPWTEQDRSNFLSACELIRKSILLHKDYARTQNIGSATADILNSSPRGIIALSTDGTVQFANSLAIKLLGCNDGVSTRDGIIKIKDKEARTKLKEFLETTRALRLDQLSMENPEAVINFKARRKSPDGSPFQVMLSSIPLSSWTIESSPSDRMVLMYIYDPKEALMPTIKQLMDYYDLTKAQAKVAAHLCSSDNIIGAAESLGVSVHTARSHLRVIYKKTDTNSQQELAKLLTSTLKAYGDKPANQ
ncbi:MAG: hypothetical protein ACR2QG_05425 [Gammaproteobacteria bacterium]